ncbi:hypothetical protein [Paenibacillus sp. J2TS4]|uniref:hypothetical protein n=1 Tax=Paenibacillus sp. J2TS4 TaxID=2807194 RepID=UPI001B269C67|nr:hypothetical protein [Paenibacillus sp. J2TS4]GIP32803.1 hypothetical protein J2TS4_20130 [Paenibacillus sp. J2TS4]
MEKWKYPAEIKAFMKGTLPASNSFMWLISVRKSHNASRELRKAKIILAAVESDFSRKTIDSY